MNKNYQKGVRFERERLKHWREVMGSDVCLRTAGSHGPFDLVIVRKGHVTLVQCKTTKTRSTGEALLWSFKEHPPLTPSPHFHQTLEVKVHGSTEVYSVTV